MQTIIAILRSALSETAQKIELCPTPGNTHKFDSWLLYKLHITDELSQPQRTCFVQYQQPRSHLVSHFKRLLYAPDQLLLTISLSQLKSEGDRAFSIPAPQTVE